MKKLLLTFLAGIALISCNEDRKKEVTPEENPNLEVHEKIAMVNGFEEFDSIKKIKFTFNVKVNDSIRSERRWNWNVGTNKISLTENDSVMSYTRKDSLAEDKKYIDQRFVNDSYWLLFPFQLKWSLADLSDPKKATAPISGDKMQMLTVSYPKDGGYTPGDSYDIYFDDEFMIREWVYKSSDGGREMATTWEDYKDFKGIKIATMHKSKDDSFELFFDDISVE
ncbi:hypothetical protein [uncultured Christiangramia sp.]|uniref:hypothetical protein n=1 Tax=uncultured Christiangramia sp. TaxID=503836 RepID=UPI0025F00916|nr:hypothetical protein [uncultured Christiangramia sp.]|tara:strand:+ start:2390 stop:3061 length:672 start_codon:yes stop_codon:yes gene_type:complete